MARQIYTAAEASRALGVSLDTLRRWDRAGRIQTTRDAGNRRLVAAEPRQKRGDQAAKLRGHLWAAI